MDEFWIRLGYASIILAIGTLYLIYNGVLTNFLLKHSDKQLQIQKEKTDRAREERLRTEAEERMELRKEKRESTEKESSD